MDVTIKISVPEKTTTIEAKCLIEEGKEDKTSLTPPQASVSRFQGWPGKHLRAGDTIKKQILDLLLSFDRNYMATDDDLPATWHQFKREWESTKATIEKHIEEND